MSLMLGSALLIDHGDEDEFRKRQQRPAHARLCGGAVMISDEVVVA